MVFFVALFLFVVVLGYMDSRLKWPKPGDKSPRYVPLSERSKTLRRD
jgi:hypothetical protein